MTIDSAQSLRTVHGRNKNVKSFYRGAYRIAFASSVPNKSSFFCACFFCCTFRSVGFAIARRHKILQFVKLNEDIIKRARVTRARSARQTKPKTRNGAECVCVCAPRHTAQNRREQMREATASRLSPYLGGPFQFFFW